MRSRKQKLADKVVALLTLAPSWYSASSSCPPSGTPNRLLHHPVERRPARFSTLPPHHLHFCTQSFHITMHPVLAVSAAAALYSYSHDARHLVGCHSLVKLLSFISCARCPLSLASRTQQSVNNHGHLLPATQGQLKVLR